MSTWLGFVVPLSCEVSILVAAIYCVYRAQKSRIYPAFWQLLVFWAGSDLLMLAEGITRRLHFVGGTQAYEIYFFTYWPAFAINAFLVLRVMHEMFRHAVRSIPGVQMLGRPIFFWAIVVSAILAFASGITPRTNGMSLLLASAQVLERSQSVLALCMLSFLVVASRTLGVSYGSRIFGVTFGLGVLATSNLVESALFQNHPTLGSTAAVTHEVFYLAAIGLWCAYFLKPEPVRRLVTIPTQSPLMRWNDVAQQLGNPAGQIPVSYPPTFMSGIQAFVDNVMGPFPTPQSISVRPPGPVAS